MLVNGNPLLEIKALHVNFRTNRGVVSALKSIDLNIYPGRTLSLIGEPGSGKSLICQSLTRQIDRPGWIDSGRILLHTGEGHGRSQFIDLAELDPNGHEMGYLRETEVAFILGGQIPAGFNQSTIGDLLVKKIRRNKNLTKKEAYYRALEWLERAGVAQPLVVMDQYLAQQSNSEARRVLIAEALCCEPRLLIVDEPLAGLDLTAQVQLMDLLKMLQKELNLALLFASRDLDVVAEISDTVAVLHQGQVVELSGAHQIFTKPQHPYTQGLVSDGAAAFLGAGSLAIPLTSAPASLSTASGCPFRMRCTQQNDLCRQYNPRLITVDADHDVRCLAAEMHPVEGDCAPAESFYEFIHWQLEKLLQ